MAVGITFCSIVLCVIGVVIYLLYRVFSNILDNIDDGLMEDIETDNEMEDINA